jgi:hypothetical protein
MTNNKKACENQSQRFVEAARELGCDEDESYFEEKLKKVARHKSPDGTPPPETENEKEG